ncbi:MAG: DUF721 domain-containing protein [Anaerohalosphaeraceae bacterium]
MSHSSASFYRIQRLSERPENLREKGPEPLANLVGRFLQERSSELQRAGRVVDAWTAAVPEDLKPYCRLAGVKDGVLSVEVPPGPYLYRFKTLSKDLLGRLQQACPSVRIRSIRLIPAAMPAEETATL